MNIFESTNRKRVPVGDVLKGLDSIAKNYDSEMTSANNRVRAAEHRAQQAEKRANDAEYRAYYHKKGNNHPPIFKGNNHPVLRTQEIDPAVTAAAEALVKILGSLALTVGKEMFKRLEGGKSKKDEKSKISTKS